VLGGLALGLFYGVLWFVYPAGMGFGDVKFSGVLGLYLGWISWGAVALGGFLGFLLGGVVGAALLVAKRATRKTGIPFGPFMILGAVLAILWGQPVVDWYSGVAFGG
jgi:leader peptidase (prepilin peptidase)/N-methyltransferase